MTPHPIAIKSNTIYYSDSEFVIPTKQHCLKVKQLMDLNIAPGKTSFIYMKGKTESTRDNTDVDLEFRQESNFFYLTGVDEPGFHVLIDLVKDIVYLITPDIPEYDIFWKGPTNYTSKALKDQYDIDDILSEKEFQLYLANYHDCIDTVYVYDHQQMKQLMQMIPALTIEKLNTNTLQPALNEARLTKFPWEINIIRQVMYGSSQAHIQLIQQFKPGMNEARLAALFRFGCAQHDIYRQAYLPIVASGPRTATLHYSKNNQKIPYDTHTLVLVDAGGERLCYGSDITRTFPATGKFSLEAKTIYNIVLKMQQSVLAELKPGVYWPDMQKLAIEILCQELIHIGILIGDPDELIQRSVPSAFYYHGLGHTVGLDVHDVGGKSKSTEDSEDLCEFLVDRPVEKGMVLTVEPGLYFNKAMLDIWTQHPGYQDYFNLEAIDKYRQVGGVRIEDTIVITEDGYENLTLVPKQINEIERLMSL